MAQAAPAENPSETEAPLYAGFWRRFAAAFLDGVILAGLFWLAIGFLDGITSGTSVKVGLGLALVLAYFCGFHLLKRQATPGKMLAGIRLSTPGGGRVRLDRIVLRAFTACASAALLLLGFTMVALDRRRRAMHDLVARTVVVRASATPEEVASAGDATGENPASTIAQLVTGVGLGAILLYFAPSFFDREKRTELTLVVQSVEPVQAEIVKALREGRPVPVGSVQPTSRFATRVYVTREGDILIRLDDERFDGAVLRLIPEQQTGKPVKWTCYSDDIRKAHLPPICRD